MRKITDLIPFKGIEDKSYEFKLKLESEDEKLEKWAKTLVGFANTSSGHMLIGVSNDGYAVGLTDEEIDKTKNLILLTINRHIFPHIEVAFETLDCAKGKKVLDVFVDCVNEMIVYKAGDYNEKVYIRDNGATLPASISQILKLSKRKFGIDGQLLDVQYEKKDFSSFHKLAREFRVDRQEPETKDLISKGIINQDGRITEGMSMFKDSYSSDDTLVACRLWNGFDKGVDQAIDKKEFKGCLCRVFEEALEFVERNSRSGFIKMKDGSRLDTFSYPEIALREAIVNALAHRDYSIYGTQVDIDIYKDRLEISSPGSWLLDKEPDEYEFDSIPSVRRNKIICSCFEVMGLMEKSGSGLKKIYGVYKDLGIRIPVLRNSPDFFKITFYDLLCTERAIPKAVGPHDAEILSFCKGAARSREEIQAHIGYASSSNFLKKVLKPLLEAGLLMRTAKPHSMHQKYVTAKE
jgi:ATP-dependent DNA helicase RecG